MEPSNPNEGQLIAAIKREVARHYSDHSSPLLLASLGKRLRESKDWPPPSSADKSLRHIIEAAHDPDLIIVRDPESPSYIAVTSGDAKPAVEAWMARRNQSSNTVPDLEAMPHSALLAFCVRADPPNRVFLQTEPPHKYQIAQVPPSEEGFVEVEVRYRRPGLRIGKGAEVSASDRLDLQSRIAAWGRDKNIAIDCFYGDKPSSKKNALERLIGAQSKAVARQMLIPADIALILSKES